jgi:hypothetical protein
MGKQNHIAKNFNCICLSTESLPGDFFCQHLADNTDQIAFTASRETFTFNFPSGTQAVTTACSVTKEKHSTVMASNCYTSIHFLITYIPLRFPGEPEKLSG